MRSITDRASSSSSADGGSECSRFSVRSPEPSPNDADQLTPPGSVPTTISEEPPPTSTTPSAPCGTWPSVREAPRNASRASRSPVRISTGEPARVADRGRELGAVRRLADRGRRDPANVGRAEVPRPGELRGDHGGHLLELVARDRSVVEAAATEVGEGALLVDRLESARVGSRRRAGGSCSSRCRCRRGARWWLSQLSDTTARRATRGPAGSRPGCPAARRRRTRSAARCGPWSRSRRTPAQLRPARPRPRRRAAARSTSSAEVRPCEARGVAFSAAREVGTNSIPSPSPTGISGRIVTGLWSGTPGIPSTSSPRPARTNPSDRGQPLAVLVDEPPGDRSGQPRRAARRSRAPTRLRAPRSRRRAGGTARRGRSSRS